MFWAQNHSAKILGGAELGQGSGHCHLTVLQQGSGSTEPSRCALRVPPSHTWFASPGARGRDPLLHPIPPALSSATHHSNATDTFHLRSPKPPVYIINTNELITQTAQLGLRQTRSRRFSEFRMEKSVCFLPFLNLQMLLSWHFPESTCSGFQHRVLFPWIPAHAPHARLSFHVPVLVPVPARGTPAPNPAPPPWHLSCLCLYSTRQTKSL